MIRRIDGTPHFHIRWMGKEDLDWECFATVQEASERARDLTVPGEPFDIEEVHTNCPLRKKIRRNVVQAEGQQFDSA